MPSFPRSAAVTCFRTIQVQVESSWALSGSGYLHLPHNFSITQSVPHYHPIGQPSTRPPQSVNYCNAFVAANCFLVIASKSYRSSSPLKPGCAGSSRRSALRSTALVYPLTTRPPGNGVSQNNRWSARARSKAPKSRRRGKTSSGLWPGILTKRSHHHRRSSSQDSRLRLDCRSIYQCPDPRRPSSALTLSLRTAPTPARWMLATCWPTDSPDCSRNILMT